MEKEPIRRMGLQFDDNSLLPLLYGEYDSNLALIEEELDVEIISKGNEIFINGTKIQLKAAQTVFDILWDRLTKGLPVEKTDVEAALRIGKSPMTKSSRNLAINAMKEANVKVRSAKKVLSACTPTQVKYLEAIDKNNVIFASGPAGTGKTFLAVAKAVEMIEHGVVDKIVLCRPAVEAGESLGFLPGTMQEKVDPYLRPIYDALHQMMDPAQIAQRLADDSIEIAPLAFMRGRTLSHAVIILDEAQNTTKTQMKMVLTRIGENSRMIVTGDLTQTDIPAGEKSGLADAIDVLKNVEGVSFIEFNEQDVVRSKTARLIVAAYEQREKRKRKDTND